VSLIPLSESRWKQEISEEIDWHPTESKNPPAIHAESSSSYGSFLPNPLPLLTQDFPPLFSSFPPLYSSSLPPFQLLLRLISMPPLPFLPLPSFSSLLLFNSCSLILLYSSSFFFFSSSTFLLIASSSFNYSSKALAAIYSAFYSASI
jgi:hypothetical protein